MIYKIPVIGYVVSFVEYQRANRAYWKVADKGPEFPEYNKAYAATWVAFDHTFEAFCWTSGFLILAAIVGGMVFLPCI
jgi:hypothetical protein